MNFGPGMLNLAEAGPAELAFASTALVEVECKGFTWSGLTGFQSEQSG
jgi:hypothetical protein